MRHSRNQAPNHAAPREGCQRAGTLPGCILFSMRTWGHAVRDPRLRASAPPGQCDSAVWTARGSWVACLPHALSLPAGVLAPRRPSPTGADGVAQIVRLFLTEHTKVR